MDVKMKLAAGALALGLTGLTGCVAYPAGPDPYYDGYAYAPAVSGAVVYSGGGYYQDRGYYRDRGYRGGHRDSYRRGYNDGDHHRH